MWQPVKPDQGGNMTQAEILQELKNLTTTERLAVIEAALHLIREDLQEESQAERLPTQSERRRQLAEAAKALLPDYTADGELTAFTALDHEEFHAEG
jgi:hypothetical protein